MFSFYTPGNRKPKGCLKFSRIYIYIEIEHCFKLVNNHGLLQSLVIKIEMSLSVWFVTATGFKPTDT